MNREIQFRIWCSLIDNWLNDDHDTNLKITNHALDLNYLPEYWIPVQWTGLKDKNGVEIFEEDIVEFDLPTHNCHGLRAEIKLDVLEGLILKTENKDNIQHLICRLSNQFKVIGNKFQNPELK